MVSLPDPFVLASFMSPRHKRDLFGKREPQLGECPYQVGLWGSL